VPCGVFTLRMPLAHTASIPTSTRATTATSASDAVFSAGHGARRGLPDARLTVSPDADEMIGTGPLALSVSDGGGATFLGPALPRAASAPAPPRGVGKR